MFKGLLNMVSGGWGSIIMTVLPWVVGAGMLVGAYFYVDHRGFERAQKLCNTANLEATITGQKLAIEDMKHQIEDGKDEIAKLKALKARDSQSRDNTKKAIENEVKDNRICDISPNVVRVFNIQRAASSNNNEAVPPAK